MVSGSRKVATEEMQWADGLNELNHDHWMTHMKRVELGLRTKSETDRI